jgi:hypothetical protein
MNFKKSTLVSISIIILVVFSYTDVFNTAAQPPGARTGAPSETTCGASDCHNNTPNSGTGSVIITFSNPELKYIPGDTFNVTVTVAENLISKWGFELTVLDATNSISPGTFLAEKNGVVTSSPTSPSFPNRIYRAHKTAGSNFTWTFPWIAPSTNIGNITFYAAGNAANGNLLKTGDHIYTTSLLIIHDPSDGIVSSSNDENLFKVQSLVYNQLTLQYNQTANEDLLINVFDLNGKLLQTLLNDRATTSGLQTRTFKLSNKISQGMYLINFSSATTSATKKIFIQK